MGEGEASHLLQPSQMVKVLIPDVVRECENLLHLSSQTVLLLLQKTQINKPTLERPLLSTDLG